MAKGDQIKILLGYLEQKDYPKALAYVKKHPKVFQAALKAMTEDIIHLFGNFANAVREKETDIAEPIYRRILELKPDDVITHYNLGILLKDKGDLKGTEQEWRAAIKADPNYSAAHNNLGLLLKNKGDLKEAEKKYRAAIKADPNNSTAHNNLAALLQNKGNLKEAENAYRKAIETDPKNSAAHYNLGLLLKNKGDRKGAEKEYRTVIKADPNNSAAHNNLGLLLENKGDRKGAEKEYRTAIKADPNNSAAHNNLGLLLKNKGDRKGAEKEYREAIEIDPNNSKAHYNLGILLKGKGDLEGAEKKFNKALEFAETLTLDEQKIVATNLARLWLDMGYLACQLGDYEDTSKKAERVLELLEKYPVWPDKKYELYSNAYFLLGIVYLQGGRNKKAKSIEHFRQAAKLSPKDARIYQNLAVAYCSAKMFKQANQSIQTAIDIKKEAGEEDERAKKLQEKIDKALNSIHIRWGRYIPITLTLIFWLVFAIWGECLFPQSKDGILWLMIVITFLASAVLLLAPVLPYIKEIGIAKIGNIRIDVESPEKWDYSSLTEMRQTIPAKPADSSQKGEFKKSE